LGGADRAERLECRIMTMIEHAPIENCDECGFRWDLYTDEQAVGVYLVTGGLFRAALDGVDLELANTRPVADSWSMLEYVEHVRAAMWIWRFVVESAIGEPGIDLSTARGRPMDPQVRLFDDVEATIAAMEAEGSELFTVLLGLEPQQWDCTARVSLGVVDQRWVVRHALHEILHHRHDVGRIRVLLGDGVSTQTGSVAQLNRGGGGVPKDPVGEADITRAGMTGDHQNDRVHHGRGFQALSLYSKDVIDALNAEGHPIYPGAAGENITVEGIDWARLRPGTVLSIGDDVKIELSSYATPCAKNAPWFADRDFRRMLHDTHPGWSRIYATVLEPGRIRAGDKVVVEP
jgi:MOSC domain-containing protein YiiM